MRKPPRLTKDVGRFDQRFRCSVVLEIEGNLAPLGFVE
jgi:hypothetical protein